MSAGKARSGGAGALQGDTFVETTRGDAVTDQAASPEGGARVGIVIAGLGASALAVVGGISFTVASNANATDAKELRAMLVEKGGPQPCLKPELAAECAKVDSAFKARDAMGDAAAWSFIAGGVLGAATVVYVLVAPKSRVRAAPAVGPHTGGLMVSGVW